MIKEQGGGSLYMPPVARDSRWHRRAQPGPDPGGSSSLQSWSLSVPIGLPPVRVPSVSAAIGIRGSRLPKGRRGRRLESGGTEGEEVGARRLS
ncbi:hypothetical protein BHE74_00048907 [Ensete ventricosum]|uniref:Uncharacterized protein n=1 Tax=Ensete ventricosum TaxID=4639 RepID=A0A426XPS3_ENSVE|nr:hypothetical protein B296_00047927 [Ensete ventricosum]RWV91620.1 hypothetical protein GW17_00046088 [Ensete ventricosum]RWW45264.1 hypothetical protein BHE74_00048907 [Ensete ventricosum]